jgi:hypothetical protein
MWALPPGLHGHHGHHQNMGAQCPLSQQTWEEIPARSKYSLAATCTRETVELHQTVISQKMFQDETPLLDVKSEE